MRSDGRRPHRPPCRPPRAVTEHTAVEHGTVGARTVSTKPQTASRPLSQRSKPRSRDGAMTAPTHPANGIARDSVPSKK